MPKRKQPPPPARPPYYIARCLATLVLGAMVWIGAAKTATTEPISEPAVLEETASVPLPPPVEHPAAVAGPTILIDPGHGGADPGTVAGGEYEKTWTLKVGTALADELRRRGWPVELTRAEDVAVALPDRAAAANRAPRLALVSIHFNSGGPEAAGVETYYAWPKTPEVMARVASVSGVPAGMALRDDRGLLLASALQASACAATGSKNRGARNDPALLVLNRTECPAVLVECGFLTNPAECETIKTDAWRAKLVHGLADGLESWLHAARAEGYGLVMEKPAVPAAAPVTP